MKDLERELEKTVREVRLALFLGAVQVLLLVVLLVVIVIHTVHNDEFEKAIKALGPRPVTTRSAEQWEEVSWGNRKEKHELFDF